MTKNLISVSCLTQKNYVISFFKDYCTMYLRNTKVKNNFLINVLFQLHVDISINYVKQNMNAIGSKHPRDNVNEKYF